MFDRLLTPPKNQSFFLFGPRGTGKSTLLNQTLLKDMTEVYDLLNPVEEDLFNRDPLELERRVAALPANKKWVVIDEIQKAPRLLDLVHRLIEKTPLRFALTGSSPRKLKRGVSNLLAGRAFVHHLHPLTHGEIGERFDLLHALRWGTLPKIYQLDSDEEKANFLRAYSLTYLNEEIAMEQIVRKLTPFRGFLEVAAQSNGQILNYAKIAHDLGVDNHTVQTYFGILEDTLVGFRLPTFHRSVRKRQRTHPKFYLFDTGVKRAMERALHQSIEPRTAVFGNAFEHFVILEIARMNDYLQKDYSLSYVRTKDDAEVDLVLERPGDPLLLIEIKSTDRVEERDVAILARFQADFSGSRAYCFSLDSHRKKIGKVHCLPWTEGIKEIGLAPTAFL